MVPAKLKQGDTVGIIAPSHVATVEQVSGMLFGHYSKPPHPELSERLKRFGDKHNVPVAYCDDFGHYEVCFPVT